MMVRPCLSVLHIVIKTFPDAPSAPTSSGHTVCLPYHLVPGMDTHSRIFHKAVATIAKQVIPAPPSSTSTVSERKARRERVFDLHHGMFFSF